MTKQEIINQFRDAGVPIEGFATRPATREELRLLWSKNRRLAWATWLCDYLFVQQNEFRDRSQESWSVNAPLLMERFEEHNPGNWDRYFKFALGFCDEKGVPIHESQPAPKPIELPKPVAPVSGVPGASGKPPKVDHCIDPELAALTPEQRQERDRIRTAERVRRHRQRRRAEEAREAADLAAEKMVAEERARRETFGKSFAGIPGPKPWF